MLGQQLLFKHKHCSVVPIHGHVYQKLCLNLKCEVSWTEKRFKIAIMYSGRQQCSREERNRFVKADVK